MIILIGQRKGGVGKSTIACNTAVCLAHRGMDVMLVDADRQATTSEWWAERKMSHPDLPKIACVNKYDDIGDTLVELDSRYGFVVVDAAGRDSQEMRSAMTVSHIMVSPYRVSGVDTAIANQMDRIIKDSRWVNPKLKALAVLSMAPTNPRVTKIEQAKSILDEYTYFVTLDQVISHREVFMDTMTEGLGVIEKAGKSDSELSSHTEMQSLVDEVLRHGV